MGTNAEMCLKKRKSCMNRPEMCRFIKAEELWASLRYDKIKKSKEIPTLLKTDSTLKWILYLQRYNVPITEVLAA